MKAFLVTTALLFGLLVAVHIWRFAIESSSGTHNPWFIAITLVAGAMCAWSLRLLTRRRNGD